MAVEASAITASAAPARKIRDDRMRLLPIATADPPEIRACLLFMGRTILSALIAGRTREAWKHQKSGNNPSAGAETCHYGLPVLVNSGLCWPAKPVGDMDATANSGGCTRKTRYCVGCVIYGLRPMMSIQSAGFFRVFFAEKRRKKARSFFY
jgi:hypothetical protein